MHALLFLAAAMITTLPAPRATATRTHAFTVALPVAEAFVLFEPIGEKRWAEDWNPVFATPESPLSDGTVFTVERAGHDGEKLHTVWLITRYDPAAYVIEYRIVVPGERVSHITVQCRATSARETGVTVTYHYTALSETGDRYIAHMTETAFHDMISEWDTAIRAYLKRGTPASP